MAGTQDKSYLKRIGKPLQRELNFVTYTTAIPSTYLNHNVSHDYFTINGVDIEIIGTVI